MYIVNITEELRDKAIIDTGCSKAVTGSKWIRGFFALLDEDDRKQVQKIKGTASFAFGDGSVCKSLGKHICPIYIAGARKFIKFHEVGYDLPLERRHIVNG